MPIEGLIDIGANLAHECFHDDLDAVLQRAWDAGLAAIVVTGSDAASAVRAVALAQHAPGRLFGTAGLHPHHAEQWNAGLRERFRALAQQPACVSLGECGLDYFRNFAPQAAQRHAFAAQLELAVECGKPVFLHQRDAHADFHAILREYRAALPAACVHCFTDTAAALEDYLALGCHIGITGWICDERRGTALYQAAGLIPDERLMIETDAPYLLPRNLPREQQRRAGRRNEPAFLPAVLERLAEARQVDAAALGLSTAANARRFFGI